MIKILSTLLLPLLVTTSALAADILVEAESFEVKGGWAVDQQFMDQMGSPYLIAHGMGVPVADASTHITVPHDGTYYAFVRTYNWTSPWHHGQGAGAFSLWINGKRLSPTLGNIGTQWMWQKAGKVTLKKGKATLRLKDLTGFDGRCDAIYLTTGNNLPSDDSLALANMRQRLLQLPSVAPSAGTFDFVVVGGGVAGISAAVSAARLGMRVALVQDRPILGGNNSSEVRVHLGGRIETGKFPNLGGLQKEFGPTEEGNAMPAENYADHKKMDIVQREPNISLFTNYHVNKVQMEGNKIACVIALNTQTSQPLIFKAPLFADCTGDATVGYLAGADYKMGREAYNEFEEPLAPKQADEMTMGASVQWYAQPTKKTNTFRPFNYGISFTEESCEPIKKGEWTWETGLNKNQITDFERIRDYGLMVVYSNWSYLKNQYSKRKKFEKEQLGWVAYVAGKRESRRLLGDYVLSEQDLIKHVSHEDASFTTTWSIDLHYPDSLNGIYFPGNEYKAISKQKVIYPYGVPYRCLYSRNIDNLFMAGRDISVTHIALGSVRVMRTTGMMGEVVGMAASLCKQHQALPRDIYTRYLSLLKQLMKKGIGGQGLPNNQQYNEGGILSKPPTVQ